MEYDFIALAAAGKEAEWLRNLIHEIPIWPKPLAPISIRCDSAPTMAREYSQIYNGKSRHLGARSKGTTYVNMKFSRFKKLDLAFYMFINELGHMACKVSSKRTLECCRNLCV
nr:zinc finger, CCHC-type [Tanacetum cinerariifolium]